MYYILSLVGYEEYHPIWFESTLSKELSQGLFGSAQTSKSIVRTIILRFNSPPDCLDQEENIFLLLQSC